MTYSAKAVEAYEDAARLLAEYEARPRLKPATPKQIAARVKK